MMSIEKLGQLQSLAMELKKEAPCVVFAEKYSGMDFCAFCPFAKGKDNVCVPNEIAGITKNGIEYQKSHV